MIKSFGSYFDRMMFKTPRSLRNCVPSCHKLVQEYDPITIQHGLIKTNEGLQRFFFYFLKQCGSDVFPLYNLLELDHVPFIDFTKSVYRNPHVGELSVEENSPLY